MQYDALILVAGGLMCFVLLFLRTNVALAILGLCAGYVFSDILSSRLSGFLYSNNYNSGSLPLESLASIGLIITPALLIILRFRHYQKGRYIQHLLPAVAFVILLAVLVVNNLPIAYEQKLIENSLVFDLIRQYELAIIAGVIALSILDILVFEFERKQHFKRLKRRSKTRHRKDK